MKKQIRYILSSVLTVLFVGYYAYNMTFVHTHFVDNISVTHSHPFSKAHNHTSSEYQMLQSVYLGAVLAPSEIVVESAPLTYHYTESYISEDTISSFYTHAIPARGPPQMFC